MSTRGPSTAGTPGASPTGRIGSVTPASESMRRELRRQAAIQSVLAQSADTEVVIPPPAPPVPAEPPVIVVKSTFRGALLVVVVGGGGNGARVVPPLMQMLRPGDCVAIVDDDIVEDRNLVRQHFSARDIGSPKAAVLTRRYRREGIASAAFQTRLTAGTGGNIEAMAAQIRDAFPSGRFSGCVIIGCVDNAPARRAMYQLSGSMGFNHSAWIDIGNEMRGGQVLMTLRGWPLQLAGSGGANFTMRGMDAMPQLLRDTPTDTPGCAERIDIQTVQVNHLAAACAINALSWLILGVPFTQVGAFFSTLNTMQPIRIVKRDGTTLYPDMSFAIPE